MALQEANGFHGAPGATGVIAAEAAESVPLPATFVARTVNV